MADDDGSLRGKCIEQPDDVAHEVKLGVLADVGGTVRLAVAALVGGYSVEAGISKRMQLMAPGIPRLREAMA